MTSFLIDVDTSEVSAALQRLTKSLEDLTPIMQEIGQAVDTHTMLGFRAGTDPYGNPWAPLSETTLSRRRGGGGQPLRDTARLQNSFSYQAGPTSVEYGTNVEYASTHQYGASKGAYGADQHGRPIPWGGIPARPMLPSGELPEALQREVLRIAEKAIRQ